MLEDDGNMHGRGITNGQCTVISENFRERLKEKGGIDCHTVV